MRISSLQRRRIHGLVAAGASLAVPATALAHPGHDHGHWASAAIHVLVLVGMAAAGAAAIRVLTRRRGHAPAQLARRADD